MDPYRELFEEYVTELAVARNAALDWWRELTAREAAKFGSAESAELALKQRWPMGPTAHPRVIAVYRKYYLAVDEINRSIIDDEGESFTSHPLDDSAWQPDADGEEDWIQHPRVVLYERLDEVDVGLARFMDAFVFIPIGMDSEGRLK